jgi:hypothetical protein
MMVQQTAGLNSGSVFPLGATSICFTAEDACGNSASCCFQVTVKENPPCDVKTSGCIKWETLSVKEDADMRTTFKIRVTNTCANPLVSADFQLPAGLVAEEPASNSVYTTPSGRNYRVTNPNFSPFYSIRFQSLQTGINNGASDIFEYTLQPQAQVTYILALVRLSPSVYYAAHLNTFSCFTGSNALDRSKEPISSLQVFPNPAEDILFVDIPEGAGASVPVRIFDGTGTEVLRNTLPAGDGPQAVDLPAQLANGVYLLEVQLPDGRSELMRFMVLRR